MRVHRTREEQKADVLSTIKEHGPCKISHLISLSRITNPDRLENLLSELIEDEKVIIFPTSTTSFLYEYDLPKGRDQPSLELEPMSH